MTNRATAYERITDALDRVQRRGNQASALCPAHEDNNRSLSVTDAGTRALVYCHAGCDIDAILSALGMSKVDLFNEPRTEYRYDDGRTVHRFYEGNDKRFKQFNTGGAPTLYRLGKVEAAVKAGQAVYLVEGEEDVHALETLGVTATTAPQGGGNFDKVDVAPLKGATVVAIPDRDATGEKWATSVKARLDGYAANLTFMDVKVGKDFSDHLAAGHGIDDLAENATVSTEPQGRQLVVQRASDIKMRATRWLWEEDQGKARWLPLGGFTLLGGREGIGKSTIAYGIAAQITQGTLPGAYQGTPKSVVICATEDAWAETVTPRLAACGADLTRVFRVDAVTQDGWHESVSLPEDNARLKEICIKEDVALLLLDPLMGAINGKLDSHKDSEVRKALEPLSRLAHDCRLTIIGLIHVNKSTGQDLLSRLMASRAFSAVARAVLFATKDEDVDENATTEKFLLGQPKNNLAAKVPYAMKYTIEGVKVDRDEDLGVDIWSSRIKWDGRKEGSIQDIVTEQENRKPEKPAGELAEKILAWIKGEGRTVTVNEILNEFSDQRRNTVEQNLSRMVDRGSLSKPLRGHYSIPANHPSEVSVQSVQSVLSDPSETPTPSSSDGSDAYDGLTGTGRVSGGVSGTEQVDGAHSERHPSCSACGQRLLTERTKLTGLCVRCEPNV